ncbi:hypothetical protein [Demequina sp. SO4-18]|uniref:hypothetical protein n=1 Tax=Demequina sp. SO4-18 TaxID=3401026 RepID=UPI003B5A54BA
MEPMTAERARARLAQRMQEALDDTPDGAGPPTIEPRSSLSRDDALTKDLTASELVWIGISAAREHLHAAARIWHSHEHGITMPTAYGTLLRTAAIGAANAYWILAPAKRDERVGRAFALAEENYRRAGEMASESLETAATMEIADSATLEREREKAARWEERRVHARDQRMARGVQDRYAATRVVKWAGGQLLTEDPSGGGQYALVWRFTSGDAHALTWQRIMRGGSSGALASAPRGPDGTIHFRDTQSEQDLLMLVELAMLTNRHAIVLYERRRRA